MHVRADSGDFRLLSRRALQALRQMREHHLFHPRHGGVGRLSQHGGLLPPPGAPGGEKRNILCGRCAASRWTRSSPFPSSPCEYPSCALVLAAINLGYLAVAAFRYLCFCAPLVPGWCSLIVAIVTLGATNLICLGILGEYVGRIYEQVKQRPLYLVQEDTRPTPAKDLAYDDCILTVLMAPPLIMDCLSAGHSPAQFDAYAADYDAGMDNPLKKTPGQRRCLVRRGESGLAAGGHAASSATRPLRREHESSIMDAVREPSWMHCDSADMKASWPAATSRSRCWPKPGGVGQEARYQSCTRSRMPRPPSMPRRSI